MLPKLTILPILDLGDVIYKIISNILLNKLDVVHIGCRPSLHIRCQTHCLQVIYKSLLGKAPPYLSSLVTIATPTIARAPAAIYHWSSPKPTPPLAVFPSNSLLPMTGTNCKGHWSWRLISPSLTISISCQSSLPITVPVHSPSVNFPPNYLIPILYLLFCTPVALFAHHHLHIYHSSVNTKL